MYIINFDKRKFPVHKNILGIQSEFLATMFKSNLNEDRNNETIFNYSEYAIEEFSYYYYRKEIFNVITAMGIFSK